MSVGVEAISGDAESARVTFNVPLQSICVTLIVLFELEIPIVTSNLNRDGYPAIIVCILEIVVHK